ncbi:MAG: hypothetical protein ACLRMJ_00285 [Alistipes finegoldii]
MQYNTAISSNQHNAGYYAAPRIAGGCSYFSPTQAFLDAIQCTDGKSIVESPCSITRIRGRTATRVSISSAYVRFRVLGMQFETNPSAQTIKNYNDKEEGVDVANSEAYGSKSNTAPTVRKARAVTCGANTSTFRSTNTTMHSAPARYAC